MTQSPQFVVGDIVQVINHPESKYEGRLGKVVTVGSSFKRQHILAQNSAR